jgi:hypothetical protein
MYFGRSGEVKTLLAEFRVGRVGRVGRRAAIGVLKGCLFSSVTGREIFCKTGVAC